MPNSLLQIPLPHFSSKTTPSIPSTPLPDRLFLSIQRLAYFCDVMTAVSAMRMRQRNHSAKKALRLENQANTANFNKIQFISKIPKIPKIPPV